MASIFDDLRNKGSGLLGDLNNFLFSDTRTQEQKDASSYGFNEVSEGLQNVYQNESKTAFTPRPVAPAPVNPNAKTPVPMNKGESTFLGAVGEYFNNAQKTWKDKGGFDALMSNPQFGIGLSLLQQASEGKTIGASALKAMVDGGIISETYAKKIAARGSVTGPATAQQIEAVKAKLAASGLAGEPTYFEKIKDMFKGESTTAKQDMAYGEIYKLAEKKAKAVAKTGKEVNIDDYLEEAAREYIATNKGVVGGSGFGILGEKSITKKVDTTKQKILEARELGGPVTKDKSYLVGEVGPEVFIPKVSGKIVSNDDSKIINLLLEANPNLKNVSPARAEKILRNRFPDYFE
jgi:hypothetical protein